MLSRRNRTDDRHAVETGKPLSAIRIGDGEGNLLTYLKHRETPVLDEIAARKIIEMQGDRFNPSRSWLFCLKHLMQGAVCDSDILGVRGSPPFLGPLHAPGTPWNFLRRSGRNSGV